MGKMTKQVDPLYIPPRNVRSEEGDVVATFFPISRKLRFQDGTTVVTDATGSVKVPSGISGRLDEDKMVISVFPHE